MMVRCFRSAIPWLCIFAASQSHAEYNGNYLVRIKEVLTYDSGEFLIQPDRAPSAPCAGYFIVPSTVPNDVRQMLLARALVAKSTGEPVNIGFDNKTCINGWYRVHRIG